MSSVIEVSSQQEWDAHYAAVPTTALLVISFHAPWAAPCAQISAVVRTLAEEFPATTPPSTVWLSVNAEELSDVSEKYNVVAVPFVALERGGIVLETVSGSSAARVREAIERQTAAKSAPTTTSDAPTTTTTATTTTPAAITTATASTTIATTNAPSTNATADAAPTDPAQKKEELFARLRDLVKAAPVMLFMKGTPSAPQCGFSRQIVAILREHAVKYGFFNILADDEVRQGLKEFAEWPTYPQLWIQGELVGGLDIVREEIANDPDFLKPYSVKADES